LFSNSARVSRRIAPVRCAPSPPHWPHAAESSSEFFAVGRHRLGIRRHLAILDTIEQLHPPLQQLRLG
jgi:hypothetical protein